jgi:hypothetical protein
LCTGAQYAEPGSAVRLRRIECVFVAACLFGLTACARTPTTVMLTIDAPSYSVTALFARVIPGPSAEQSISGPVTLPGTLLVLLSDTATPTTIALRAETQSGTTLFGSAALTPIPHQQATMSVTLSPTPGGPLPCGAACADGGTGSDLSGPADFGIAPFASPPDMASNVIAQDDFRRGNQAHWGVASDGQTWGADANSVSGFAITNKAGTDTESTGNDTAVLGPSVADADVLINGSISTFGASNNPNEVAAMLRWTDSSHFYKAGIDGARLRLFVKNGAGTTLAQVPFTASAGTDYALRFRVVGTSLSAKVWPANATEPSSFMVTATDNGLDVGMCGIRLVFNATATASFHSFVATGP